jgi:hypothetical protein
MSDTPRILSFKWVKWSSYFLTGPKWNCCAGASGFTPTLGTPLSVAENLLVELLEQGADAGAGGVLPGAAANLIARLEEQSLVAQE